MNDIPCTCGHLKIDHAWDKTNCGVCQVMRISESSPRGNIYADDCYVYIPDNLSYIERLAKERGLV